MQNPKGASQLAGRFGRIFMAAAVASLICMPAPVIAQADDMPLTATPDSSDTAELADYPYSITLERTNDAPEVKAEFFIEDDGTALTWDEFFEKYYDEDEASDDEEDEGEDADDLDEYEDCFEDEEAEVDLEDNGWFLDTDEFRWYYYAEEAEAEYAEGSIPAKYAAAATADGLAFGKLHDSDFGGIWYFSESGACWHLIDENGRDHAKPSPELLAGFYEKYAGSEEEESDSDIDDEDADAADDAEEADEEADDEEDSLWDDERWEDRAVGYGFAYGDTVTFRATIANAGSSELSLDLAALAEGETTDPAVFGYYPLDGSGTHDATDPAPEDSDDESDADDDEDAAEDGEEPLATQDEDGDEAAEDPNNSDPNAEDDAAELDIPVDDGDLFGQPTFTSVGGEGVVWENKDESENSEVAPRITVPAGATAVIEYSVKVAGHTDRVLAANAEDDTHGYVCTAVSSNAQAKQDAETAQDENLATAADEDGAEAAETTVPDKFATACIPTDYSGIVDEAYANATAKDAGAASAPRGATAKAWKRHASASAKAKATPTAAKTTATTAKTGDDAPIQGLAVLAALSLALAAASGMRLRNQR